MTTSHRFNRLFEVSIDIGVIQNGFGVNANVVVDDELQTSQANPVVGQLAEIESQLRVAHVHHDFHVDGGHVPAHDFRHLDLKQSFVDVAGISLGTTDRDQCAIGQLLSGIATAHHRRNAQFTCNDGCVAGATTAVGDNGAGALHDGFPVGIGHVCDQHITGLHFVHFSGAVHQTHWACSHLLANGSTTRQNLASTFQHVALLGCAFGLTFDCFRSSLQNVELPIGTIFAPLDVHGTPVMLLDEHGVAGQFKHIGIAQAIPIAHFDSHVFGFDQLAAAGFFGIGGKHHLNEF